MVRARRSIWDNNDYNEYKLQNSYIQSSDESVTSGSLTASTASLLGPQQYNSLSLANSNKPSTLTEPPPPQYSYALQKQNYKKILLPGAAKRLNHATAAVIQVTPYEKTSDDRNSGGINDGMLKTIGSRIQHSIRRIRRPRQWQQPTKSTESHDENALTAVSTTSFYEKGKAFIIEFLHDSSIHGFIYLAKIGLNFIERMLWFAFICVALFSIMSLSKRTWERFQTSPMVISMDRNKLVWNTSFPSLTVCPHKRIDELKVEEYIELHPESFETEEDKDDFRIFIEKLASLSYDNIETLPLNKTFGIASEKYLELLYELKWSFEPELSSGAAVKMFIYETLTEFGICHSVNSLVARYNSFEYWKKNMWNLLEHGDRVTVHPLDGEIYAQIINLSTAYDVYFHSAGDIPNISKQRYTFPESDYTTVELIALEIYTAEEARAFTTKQRKCRYQYEAEDMLSAPIYSFGLCLAECRMFFSMKICGCVPHFYRNRLRNGRILPVCGLKGIACLSDIKSDIISLKSEKYKIDCRCLSNCDDSNFFVQSYRSRVWFLGANLQWGIIDYPKMQLRRDVLFSFADMGVVLRLAICYDELSDEEVCKCDINTQTKYIL
ncbi:uncharacterized protein LOC119674410 [Teleopsis dalmanni]|uniref:uncharacterized protein LOC119674410 n=1 Tax=Teleopsis dalmanni TaxID=139649 RepID=UPI0018CFB004|nr:uncharacterized protein LOC119674410 [Teleopsis dalmanni]